MAYMLLISIGNREFANARAHLIIGLEFQVYSPSHFYEQRALTMDKHPMAHSGDFMGLRDLKTISNIAYVNIMLLVHRALFDYNITI